MAKTLPTAGGNAELAAKCFPSGTKNEATSTCLYGDVEINLKTNEPLLTAFCHCWACRRAHSEPVYQCIYVATSNFCSKTGHQREAEFELTVTSGFDLLTRAKMGPGNPNYETMDANPKFGGLGRIICSKCGVVMMTALFTRPHREFNDGEKDALMVCVFPGTFTEKISEFIQAWLPTNHVHCASAIFPISAINDGLDKRTEWPDSEPWTG